MNDNLVLENKGLIFIVLKNMGIIYNLEEFYEVGEIGLIKAARGFNENAGYKFSTYATKFIHNEICVYITYKLRERRKDDYKTISLFGEVEEDLTLIETIDSGIDIEEEILKLERIELLNKIIAILEPKDRYMLEHYFGLRNKKELTQVQIAKNLGVDKRYVHRRIKRALRIIKKIMEDKVGDKNE